MMPPFIAKNYSAVQQLIAAWSDDYSEMHAKRSKPINVVLAENIAAAMKKAGIETQQQLAKLSGVSQRTISNYLNPENRQEGKSGKTPSAKLVEVDQIAMALGVDAWALLREYRPGERDFYDKIEAAYLALNQKQGELN